MKMVTVIADRRCSWCGGVYGQKEVSIREDMAEDAVTHGICPDCYERMQATLDAELAAVDLDPVRGMR